MSLERSIMDCLKGAQVGSASKQCVRIKNEYTRPGVSAMVLGAYGIPRLAEERSPHAAMQN
jgi:hypothetical protein